MCTCTVGETATKGELHKATEFGTVTDLVPPAPRGSRHSNCYQMPPTALGVSFNLILQSQFNWSSLNGTCQRRRRELDVRLIFENAHITPEIQ